MGEMVTARVDEHGRMVRLYVWQGRREDGADLYLSVGGQSLDEGDEQLAVSPGAEPPRWRSLDAEFLRELVLAEEARMRARDSALGGGASEVAVQAVVEKALAREDGKFRVRPIVEDATRLNLAVAHDPALGLDRSVCLRDVVEALKARHPERGPGEHHAAEFLEREFGGAS